MAAPTVREATFDVWREYGLTSIFANPGSTEIKLLADLPDDFRFVLGAARGLGRRHGDRLGDRARRARARDPAHDRRASATPSARSPRRASTARRSSSSSASRTGATSPPSRSSPASCAGSRASTRCGSTSPCARRTCPGAIARAVPRGRHRERAGARDRADGRLGRRGRRGRRARRPAARRARLAADDRRRRASSRELIDAARAPGARRRRGRRRPRDVARRSSRSPSGSAARSGRSRSARAPDSRRITALFAGHLPADRVRLRETLAPHDVVLVVGAPVFRQYPFIPGPFVEAGTRRRDGQRATRRRCTAAPPTSRVLAPPGRGLRASSPALVPARDGSRRPPFAPPAAPAPPAAGEPLRAGHVFAAIAERLPRNAIVIEESPSSRPELLARLPARESLGSLSPAMGGLGFALPAAIGLRMARPDRPVVAIVGDGSSLYSIQALWSAAQYRAGALFVILANGGYAIMDRLAEQAGGSAPWPGFAVDVAGPRARASAARRARVSEPRRAARGARRGAARPRRARRAAPARGRGRPGRDLRAVTSPGARFRSPRRDASEQVAFEIRRYLSARDLRPGERLGTEQELAAEFGVSRPTLREGLRLLASSHLIRASQGPGGGIFVESTQSEGMRRNVSESIAVMLETDDVSLDELIEARISLEVPLAGLAAQHATDATAAELLAAIAEAEGNHPASEAFRLADTQLPPRDRERGPQRAPARVHELDARRAAAVADRHDRRLDRRRRDPAAAPRDPARHPPAPPGRRPARDAPSPRLPARARRLARTAIDLEPEGEP